MDYKDYKAYADALLAQRDQHKSTFAEWGRMVMPTSWAAMQEGDSEGLPGYIFFCEEANHACQMLAAAHMQMLTPFDARWFNISLSQMGSAKHGDEAEAFQTKAAQAMWVALGKSNFTSVINAMYLDRCAIGHGAIMARVTPTGKLVFTHVPAGTFGLAHNEQGICNAIVREFELSAAQAVDRYGREVGEKIVKAYDDPKKRFTERFKFHHLIMPNKQGQKGFSQRDVKERAYLETVISVDEKKLVEENGLYEFPVLATRFTVWGESPFGVAPASLCRDSIIRLEKEERRLDALGDKAVDPPYMIDAAATGKLSLMPGAINPHKEGQMLPVPLEPRGNYNVGLERISRFSKNISAAYFSDIVKPLASLENPKMTATEVRARQQENIVSFVHSFSMMIAEMAPFIRSLFSILYRWGYQNDMLGDAGIMPAIPDGLQEKLLVTAEDGKDFYFNELEVSFTSRLAMALKELTLSADMQAISTLGELINLLQMPELIDNVDVDNAFRDHVRGLNSSSTLLRPKKEVDQIRQQRMQAQQAQAQMQQEAAQAGTAKDIATAYNMERSAERGK